MFFFHQSGHAQRIYGIQAGAAFSAIFFCKMLYIQFSCQMWLLWLFTSGLQSATRCSCSVPEEMSSKELENLLRVGRGMSHFLLSSLFQQKFLSLLCLETSVRVKKLLVNKIVHSFMVHARQA